ncbi:thioredoxin-like protein [Canariomyces notabilis]|uniref:Thioredoxin-like protein n=1 Tax=Canariomyces notabilis TaxID=2074819 RepID=A0AAN6QET5_9PEZI|nr:thioredoxin-like protein [Canariomyces arenarius]
MSSSDRIRHIASLDEFNSLLSSTRYVVADFYADWCGPCKAIAPHFQQFAAASSIDGFLAFAKINVDKAPTVAQKYGVAAMPTFLFFKDGKQVGVNGAAMIQGANLPSLKLAVEKMSRLAKEKADAAAAESA